MARAKKRTDGRYCVQIVVGHKDGKPIRKSFYSKVNIADAKRIRNEWMQTHNYGGDGAPTPKVDGSITLDAWVERWLASYKLQLELNTQDFYKFTAQSFQNFVRDGIRYGDMSMMSFKPFHISEYLASNVGASKSSIRAKKITIKQIFETAKANGIIDRDFCADVQETVNSIKVKGTYDGHKALPRDMIDLICRNYTKHRFGLFVMIGLFSGMRPGEIAGLRWSDVDMKNSVIHVRQARDLNHAADKETKTENGVRDIPIFAPLQMALIANRATTEYVCFGSDGNPIGKDSARSGLESFCSFVERIANGVQNPEKPLYKGEKSKWIATHGKWKELKFTLYDLRVTFCTTLYDAGVDLKTAQKLMGHADATTTLRIYTKLSEERETKSTDKMEAFLAENYGF